MPSLDPVARARLPFGLKSIGEAYPGPGLLSRLEQRGPAAIVTGSAGGAAVDRRLLGSKNGLEHMTGHEELRMARELQRTTALNAKLGHAADTVGNLLVDAFHYLALFAIGGAIVWSAIFAFVAMGEQGTASIADILLLFIYLELGAMVGIYFKTNHMPVRFLIYVAITALTRVLIADIQLEHKWDVTVIYLSGSILLLALANLVIRYGSFKFPSAGVPEEKPD